VYQPYRASFLDKLIFGFFSNLQLLFAVHRAWRRYENTVNIRRDFEVPAAFLGSNAVGFSGQVISDMMQGAA
jgi:hypothetical protein